MQQTDTWWVVQLKTLKDPVRVCEHLYCVNPYGHQYRKTPKGRKVPRQWSLSSPTTCPFRFRTLADARRSAKSAKVIRAWLRLFGGFIEIVEVTGDLSKIVGGDDKREVVERIGCPPLLCLALEAV